jgi:hypothetical protein
MTWRVDYLMTIEGESRGGQRERELPKGGLVAIEPQKDFLVKEANGGIALRKDLKNRGFDVDDVGASMVYKGALTKDGKQILWVPYARYWSHTIPLGYHTYYVPLTLEDVLSPEEQAARKRAEADAKAAALEAEKEQREAEARAAKARREAELRAEQERREQEQRDREEQRRLAQEMRQQAADDQRRRLEDARQAADAARIQAEIDRLKPPPPAASAPPPTPASPPTPTPPVPDSQLESPRLRLPASSGFKVVEIFGVMGGTKVPFPMALQARLRGDPSAQITVTENPAQGFGLAGDETTWRRYVPSGDTLGHRPDRGVVAWDGTRAVPLDAATLSQMLPPGWQALVYG